MSRKSSASIDPRFYQIGILSTLLVYGLFRLDFPVRLETLVVTIGTAIAAQWVFSRWVGLPRFDPRSALISSLSLCLLLRSSALYLMAVAALLAVGSKFLLRSEQGHWFNPAGFAIVVMLASSDSMWVSTGQWGQTAWFGLLVASLGLLVIQRSQRTDITLAFLIAYALMLLGRAWWLGDPLTIPWLQFQSGALLIFAFFMISDPMTSPRSRSGRILYAIFVTLGAGFGQFILYKPESLFFSLVLCTALVPLLNRYLPGERFHWKPATNRSSI